MVILSDQELQEMEERLEATSEIPLATSRNHADLIFINFAKRDMEKLLAWAKQTRREWRQIGEGVRKAKEMVEAEKARGDSDDLAGDG